MTCREEDEHIDSEIMSVEENIAYKNCIRTKLLPRIRWPTTVTSKPKCSQQIQITHIKFKTHTANSKHSQQITNRSQQIHITHSKLQIVHSKFKSLTTNYKSFTTNSNHSQQITNRSQQIQITHNKLQIVHNKFKSPTANYKLLTLLSVFSHLQPAVQDV